MEIKIISLSYSNFKGGSETLIFDGQNADVFGTNRAGKTRTLDAWDWLLTEKDSQDSAQFGIKPVAGLKAKTNITVEAVITIDGSEKVLKKEYAEKWTTKRGAANAEFTGHTTEYFIDGTPVGLKGFDAFLGKIVDKAILPCFTNLRYFNERFDSLPTDGKKKKLSPQEARRAMLVSMFGDVTDADVIKTDPAFTRLPLVLNGKTSEEYRLGLDYQLKKIKDERAEIPTRIDEKLKELPPSLDVGPSAAEKSGIESRLSVLRNELSMIESGGEAGLKKAELLAIENQISEIEVGLRKKADAEAARLRGVTDFCQKSLDDEARRLRLLKNDLIDIDAQIAAIDKNKVVLIKKWKAAKARQFVAPEIAGHCPVCGADPEHQINFSEEKALAAFNIQKAEEIAGIDADAKLQIENRKKLEAGKTKLEKGIADAESKITVLKTDLETAQKNQALAAAKLRNTALDPAIAPLIAKRDAVHSELSEIALGNHDATDGIYAEIGEQEKKLAEINKKLADIDAAQKTKDRISELEADEKRLSAEWERMEADRKLIEDFTRAKCAMLTDRINGKFRITRWQLFENLINSGIKDTCTAMAQNNDGQWVQYGDLNNESKVNVGIDCINTLSDHYGVALPIFIDDADLIIKSLILETKSQLIRLIVSEEDKQLRVKTYC